MSTPVEIRVVHTVASLHPDTGGPARTVSATCEHLAAQGTNVEIVTRRQGGEAALAPDHPNVTTTFSTADGGLRGHWDFRRVLSSRLEASGAALVHDHGVWLPTNLLSAVEAWRHGCPLVVTTRGMLEPWALRHQKWKKRLAWGAYQRGVLRQAALLHATAPMEAKQLRRLGLTAPIAVIPNGVPLPDRWRQAPTTDGPRQALFLSRIHPKKGLPSLVDAWARVRPDGWRLVIAGPSEDGHRAEVEARVQEHGLGDVVSFPGPVADDDKWALYRESDLFVLPTHSENFGVVVAEALASGVPALTTTGAPWSVLEEEDCGWWVEPEGASLEAALADAVGRPDDERLAMGRRGRALVEARFSWSSVATKMKAAYRWVLGDGPRPDFIREE
jgi:glycosyltransferase involved in cell wall biosynthesis